MDQISICKKVNPVTYTIHTVHKVCTYSRKSIISERQLSEHYDFRNHSSTLHTYIHTYILSTCTYGVNQVMALYMYVCALAVPWVFINFTGPSPISW